MNPTPRPSPYIWPGCPESRKKAAPPTAIIRAVCTEMRLAPCELHVPGRKREVARARFICWLLMKKHHPRMVQAEAAGYFNRDRTSLIHGLESIRNDLNNEPELRAMLDKIEHRIAVGV